MDLFVKKTASSFVKNGKIFTIRQRAFLHYIYRYIYTHRTRATRVVIILLMRSKGLFRIYWLCVYIYTYIYYSTISRYNWLSICTMYELCIGYILYGVCCSV